MEWISPNALPTSLYLFSLLIFHAICKLCNIVKQFFACITVVLQFLQVVAYFLKHKLVKICQTVFSPILYRRPKCPS